MTAGVTKTIYGIDGDGYTWTGNSGDDFIYAGNGIQTLYGNAGNDLLVAGTGDQKLYGGSGNDWLIAGNGNQTLDGGSGVDIVDFSKLNGRIVMDQDLYTATLYDQVTGAVIYTYAVKSFNGAVGTSGDDEFYGQANTPNTYQFGAGNDKYHSESGGDMLTGGAGADTYGWMKKYVAVGHIDTITDFEAGIDRLDMSDFLKGQGIKNATYAQVVRVNDFVNADGSHSALVQTLGAGTWHDTALLQGINIADVGADHHALTLADLGLK